ncbi:glycerophosphodiester phosphodiesterase family protein [Sphingomonas astaxanthinifaciens]|uniref:Glycerophosphoryl diester phosphodiesterase n=1 Tax=Sphingomonas astaxanthinifaciens DSM 22298 TaxID=1123267 RepID=A0ABQ5Z812_9SPHN|nr:glycerophosphodiester phosphodiesterase family protein [Sphingomonas astaxanthinifaciens]GLR47596.1 glycerophosphoryl diester phosphodiesterase [Sphingomonas astaxanthinifaciens DSM 22298]
MSRSGPDPLDPGPRGFAHRGLHDGSVFPENSLIAFAASLEAGAGIECDLRLTADDEILVFHDANAWRLCGSPLVIGRSTHAELARLRIGEQPIPTLASLLALVGGRAPMLLEVKVDADRWRWMPALRRALAGYRGPFGVMSFDPGVLRILKTNAPEWRRGLVVADRLGGLKRSLALALADPDFLAVETFAAHRAWVARQRRKRPVYSWTVRTPAQRTDLVSAVDALIWEGDGRP